MDWVHSKLESFPFSSAFLTKHITVPALSMQLEQSGIWSRKNAVLTKMCFHLLLRCLSFCQMSCQMYVCSQPCLYLCDTHDISSAVQKIIGQKSCKILSHVVGHPSILNTLHFTYFGTYQIFSWHTKWYYWYWNTRNVYFIKLEDNNYLFHI